MKYIIATVVAGLGLAGLAQAVPTVDGTLDAEYGAALAVQTVETQFGDNQSELDAAYATVSGGTLYIMLTGNLENNFNKLNIFIDSTAGGQNTINSGANPNNDSWATGHNGMTFDTGFEPDYLLITRNGFSQFDMDYAVIGGGATSFDAYGNVFGGSTQGSATTPAGANLGFSFMVGFNNSNAGGVAFGTAAANQAAAQAVTTGLEIGIPLAAIGNPANPGDISVSVMVNNGNHNYLSNQFLGGLPAPQGNLGGDGAGGFTGTLGGINLNNFAGDQYFVVPEPSALALGGLGLLVLAAARRRLQR